MRGWCLPKKNPPTSTTKPNGTNPLREMKFARPFQPAGNRNIWFSQAEFFFEKKHPDIFFLEESGPREIDVLNFWRGEVYWFWVCYGKQNGWKSVVTRFFHLQIPTICEALSALLHTSQRKTPRKKHPKRQEPRIVGNQPNIGGEKGLGLGAKQLGKRCKGCFGKNWWINFWWMEHIVESLSNSGIN